MLLLYNLLGNKIYIVYTSSLFSAVGIQMKWKGIRSCYTRELLKKKKEKSGSSASGQKEYVCFETLRFLETVSKHTANSMNDQDNFQHNRIEEGQEISPEMQDQSGLTEKRLQNRPKKRGNSDDSELIQALKNKILHESKQASDENDEDRMFLLSLVSELHKVPADRKLKVRSDIISTITQAQQVYQQCPPQYQTPPTYHTPHLLQGTHYAQQPTFHAGHQFSAHQPPQKRHATVVHALHLHHHQSSQTTVPK